MKRIATLVLAMLLVLCLLAGTASATEKVTILYPGEESDRMTELLSGELGAALLQDLDMQIEMIYVPWGDYWNMKTAKLQAGDAIDLY